MTLSIFPTGTTDQDSIVTVPIGLLSAADSPRLSGEDDDHVRALAESGAALPPIVVHRPTMRVVDGMHRVRAAALRGLDEIEVRFIDGDDKDAFVVAVALNVTHGLPLSLADRRAAAARIIVSHPGWSDRMIASTVGLAPRTVGIVRRQSAEEIRQSNSRLGRDGRIRPVNGEAGRARARALLLENPNASLRAVARIAGIAPSTVRLVRNRLRSESEPDTVAAPRRSGGAAAERPWLEDRDAALRSLKNDPSLRFNEVGRALLRWLDATPAGPAQWARIVDNIPAHCAQVVADLARANATAWREFADHLEQRQDETATG